MQCVAPCWAGLLGFSAPAKEPERERERQTWLERELGANACTVRPGWRELPTEGTVQRLCWNVTERRGVCFRAFGLPARDVPHSMVQDRGPYAEVGLSRFAAELPTGWREFALPCELGSVTKDGVRRQGSLVPWLSRGINVGSLYGCDAHLSFERDLVKPAAALRLLVFDVGTQQCDRNGGNALVFVSPDGGKCEGIVGIDGEGSFVDEFAPTRDNHVLAKELALQNMPLPEVPLAAVKRGLDAACRVGLPLHTRLMSWAAWILADALRGEKASALLAIFFVAEDVDLLEPAKREAEPDTLFLAWLRAVLPPGYVADRATADAASARSSTLDLVSEPSPQKPLQASQSPAPVRIDAAPKTTTTTVQPPCNEPACAGETLAPVASAFAGLQRSSSAWSPKKGSSPLRSPLRNSNIRVKRIRDAGWKWPMGRSLLRELSEEEYLELERTVCAAAPKAAECWRRSRTLVLDGSCM